MLSFFQTESQTTYIGWCQTEAGVIQAHQRPILTYFLPVQVLLAQNSLPGECVAVVRQTGLEARKE